MLNAASIIMTNFTLSAGLHIDLPVVGVQLKSQPFSGHSWAAGTSRLFSESLTGPAWRMWI